MLFVLVSAFLLPLNSSAQVCVFEEDFSTLTSGVDNYFKPLDGDESYSQWSFLNCYAPPALKKGLFVGKTDEVAQFTTPILHLKGVCSVVVQIKRGGTSSAHFTARLSGNASLRTSYFTAMNSTDYEGFILYIADGEENTRLTIATDKGEKIYVQNIKAYRIDDAIFYESFDNVDGSGGNDGSFRPGDCIISGGSCAFFDNCLGAAQSTLLKGYKCVYAASETGAYYTTAPMGIELQKGRAVLSFRIAGSIDYNSQEVVVSCSGGGTLGTSVFATERNNWNNCYTIVNDVTSSTQFTFRSRLYFLDDVKVSAIPANLDESKDNMIYVTAYAGETVNVTLLRTLTANIWCPLCLPFDVTQAQMEVATGTSCELRTLTSVSEGVFNFDVTTSIAAGTPFLVKTAAQVVNPVFTGVTVVSTPAATAADSTAAYQFVGTYSPVTLATDGSNLFLGIDGKLYRPEAYEGHDRMSGLRAYFVVPATTSPSRVAISVGGETAGVNGSRRDKAAPERLYDLQGHPVKGRMTKGLYVQEGQKVLRP